MPKQESKRRWSNKRTQMTGIKGTASISPNPTSTSNLPHSTHFFSRTISIRFWTGIWKELATVTANLKFLKMNSHKSINNKNSISKTSVDVRDSKLEKNASYQYLFHLFWSLLKRLEVIKDHLKYSKSWAKSWVSIINQLRSTASKWINRSYNNKVSFLQNLLNEQLLIQEELTMMMNQDHKKTICQTVTMTLIQMKMTKKKKKMKMKP
jgi:hypothetical protein